ncbi:MAG: NAD kinase [Actinobacteria bacterium]|nr:NAD kinase [Actinomycetota bacterium]NCW42348.1 NAD kinase [Actinomycetota bacterium]NCW95076.1 NAD kinase [Actinomycetota bacterium]NCX63819.1 NAD kinase [Actinomycetota bacterium]
MQRVLIVISHADDAAAQEATNACKHLAQRGIACVFDKDDLDHFTALGVSQPEGSKTYSGEDLDLVMVLGGDGSILRAAEIVNDNPAPILGINLGHVGFMTEAERSEIPAVLDAVAAGNFSTSERTTLEVKVWQEGKEVFSSWAINEVAVEKSARERMLEVVLEIDARPVSSFGCDGVLVSTPTGSTAYAFSAGGPVVWPNVEAFVVVPLSAHALFARPLVIDPESTVAVEVLRRSPGSGVLWCDGRRTFDLGPGARIEVAKRPVPVKMVVLDNAPFADRLVRKFSLPVSGWRGPEAEA